MSSYASKWEPITREEYFKIYSDRLSVYSSYTNPDGDDGLSWTPKMLTTWGDNDRELIKSIATRDREDEDPIGPKEWNYKYWKAIKWESKD